MTTSTASNTAKAIQAADCLAGVASMCRDYFGGDPQAIVDALRSDIHFCKRDRKAVREFLAAMKGVRD